MTQEHVLGGCTPTPLAHYLKALGVHRLVAEQKDADAAGRWQGEEFVLRTRLSRHELESFILQEYRPSPMVAPWNGGSGFYPKDNKDGIDAIRASATPRLQLFKEVLASVSTAVEKRVESPKDQDKVAFLVRLRSELPDAVLPWFDAAVMLLTDRPGYPPLLGSGGNDGRLDFTNNFMQRLAEVIDPVDGTPTRMTAEWLQGALYGQPIKGLVSHAIGQFAPGNAGGPNATTGFDAASSMNPWDFILMLEGALLFAGAATRRLGGSDVSAPSYPLTVKTTGAGSGCGAMADETPSRAEIWLPLWFCPIGLAELKLLFAEARVTLGRRPVRDGLEFVRALGSYGTDRGIAAFQRYGFLRRSGKNFLAAPLGRVQVRRNPEADLLADLDHFNWLSRLRSFARSATAPGRFRQWVRRLEDAVFSLARFGQRQELQTIMILLGQLQQACAVSAKGREAVSPPPLLGSQWALQADDQTDEFRIACALAGLHDMRRFLVPLQIDQGRAQWDPGSHLAVQPGGDLISNLVRVLRRRLLEARRSGQTEPAGAAFAGRCAADLAAVTAFIRRETDDARIAALLGGLINVRPPDALPDRKLPLATPPGCYTVLKPLFTPEGLLRAIGALSAEDRLPLPDEIVALLTTDHAAQVVRALNIGWRSLHASPLRLPKHPRTPPTVIGLDGPRLAASLMIPLTYRELRRVLSGFEPSSHPQVMNQQKED